MAGMWLRNNGSVVLPSSRLAGDESHDNGPNDNNSIDAKVFEFIYIPK